jgi:hypothetical protein
VVEVFCRAEADLMRSRYAQRTPGKGDGHFDEQRPDEELWPEHALRPLDGGWPVVEVDTSGPVDVREVAERVPSSSSSSKPRKSEPGEPPRSMAGVCRPTARCWPHGEEAREGDIDEHSGLQ